MFLAVDRRDSRTAWLHREGTKAMRAASVEWGIRMKLQQRVTRTYPQHHGKIKHFIQTLVKFLTSCSWDSFFLEDKFKCFSKMPQYFSVSLSYFFLASWQKQKRGKEKKTKMLQEWKQPGSNSSCSSSWLRHSLRPRTVAHHPSPTLPIMPWKQATTHQQQPNRFKDLSQRCHYYARNEVNTSIS